jgi:curved DNA-binding protein
MEFKDYYDILGVADAASAAEIKTSYRKLARKYHPDVNKAKDSEDKFKELGEAYEVLKDPEKRAEYDQLRKLGAAGADGNFQPPPGWQSTAGFSGGGYTGADSHHFSDFFESIFGAGGAAQRGSRSDNDPRSFRRRGEDLQHSISLSLEDAQHGVQRQLKLTIPETDEYGRAVAREKTLNVKIPANVLPGQRIRLGGQGAAGSGGAPAGDLFLQVEFAPHPYFSVDGKNIILALPISAPEAALGATLSVPTLGGNVNLKIPKGSSSGDKLRLRGKGLAGDVPGDQLVILKVALPKQHTEAAEALYRQVAEQESAFNPRAELTPR